MTDPPVWLVLADPLSTRILLDCGIAEELAERYGSRLQPVFLFDGDETDGWAARFDGRGVLFSQDLVPPSARALERVLGRGDRWLTSGSATTRSGRSGSTTATAFTWSVCQPGRAATGCSIRRESGPLPRRDGFERAMSAGILAAAPRSAPVPERLRAERRRCLQQPADASGCSVHRCREATRPGARRLCRQSRDDTVGRNDDLAARLDRYVVQNDVMRDDRALPRGDPARVVVAAGPRRTSPTCSALGAYELRGRQTARPCPAVVW